jgi:translation elongation factor EF-1beta
MRYLWYTSIAFGLFGLICAVCVREMDYLLTDHIQVDLTKVKKMNQGVTEKELEAARTEGERH